MGKDEQQKANDNAWIGSVAALIKKYKARKTIAPQALYQSFYLYNYTKKATTIPLIKCI